jgi:hypothetical protein
MGCNWLAAAEPAKLEADAAAGVLAEAEASAGDAAAVPEEPVVPDDRFVMLLSVWLIDMSWSSWLRDTIWPTISVGSTGAVGSWFCNSVTNRFKKVS